MNALLLVKLTQMYESEYMSAIIFLPVTSEMLVIVEGLRELVIYSIYRIDFLRFLLFR